MTNSSETINLPLKMNTVHYLTILYFLLISLSELSAQNNGDFPTSLRICSDNDFYKMRDGTDRYYSSGLTAEFQPGTRQERIGLKAAFPRLSSRRPSLGMGFRCKHIHLKTSTTSVDSSVAGPIVDLPCFRSPVCPIVWPNSIGSVHPTAQD